MGNKVTPDNITQIDNSSGVATVNDNFDLVADEFDKVMYRDGSQTATGDTDMDSNRIINLPDALTATEPVPRRQIEELTKHVHRGDTGPANNTYFDLATFKAQPVTNGTATLIDVSKGDWYVDDAANYSAATKAAGEGYVLAASTDDVTKIWVKDRPNGALASDFGIINDEYVSDQRAKWQAYFDYLVASNTAPAIPSKAFRTRISGPIYYKPNLYVASGLSVGNIDLTNYEFRVDAGQQGLVFGEVGKLIFGTNLGLPGVYRAVYNWGGENSFQGDDSAITIYNGYFSNIHGRAKITGFTNGLVMHSENYGFAYCRVDDMNIEDCRHNEVRRTKRGSVVIGGEFFNQNLFRNHKLRMSSAANASGTAYAVVTTWDKGTPGSYRGANNNVDDGHCFELGGAPVGATWRIPFFYDGCGYLNHAKDFRYESGKGPVAIVINKSPAGVSSTTAGTKNKFYGAYVGGAGDCRSCILEVGGAYGNIFQDNLTPPPVSLQVDNVEHHVSTAGTATGNRVYAPFFTKRFGSSAPHRTTTFTTMKTNHFGLQQESQQDIFCLRIPTDAIKSWQFSHDFLRGFGGRPSFQAFDSAGVQITADSSDTIEGTAYTEPPVVVESSVYSGNLGGFYTLPTDNITGFYVRAGKNTAYIDVFVAGGTKPAVYRGVRMVGYSVYVLPFMTMTYSEATVYHRTASFVDPINDGERTPGATANPATAGLLGKYGAGEMFRNTAAASAAPMGWLRAGTSGGVALAKLRVNSTVMVTPGEYFWVNDTTQRIYRVVTVGTLGTSVPTGTTVGVAEADGTATVAYVGLKAEFIAMANAA